MGIGAFIVRDVKQLSKPSDMKVFLNEGIMIGDSGPLEPSFAPFLLNPHSAKPLLTAQQNWERLK